MNEHPAALAARALVTTLVAQGVRDAVIAPGSRSAPLAYALAAAADAGWLRVHVRVDERVASFVALGIAHERPAAVITTSGTAVANLHPAVLEAHHAHRPLLVVSADRPHELRGVGANQTTDQPGLFGGAVRDRVELPADGEAGIRQAVVRAVAAATGTRGGPPGPVHLNVAFRDPLTPAQPWEPGAEPTASPAVLPTPGAPAPIELAGAAATVIVAGDGAGPAAHRLATAGRWPILAEPSSGARGSDHAIPAYRRLLETDLARAVERVVVLGRPTLSRDVSALLARDIEAVVVSPSGTWTDVAGTADVVAAAAVAAESAVADPGWLEDWQRAGAQALASILPSAPGGRLTGAAVAHQLLGADQPHRVMLGSSLSIRHADLSAPTGAAASAAAVHANRGLAGIDGTLSTATGLALATGSPVRALVGDLTFLHDVGALARGEHEPEVDLQVLVLDDHGGGIFALLEHGQARHAATFARFFGTAQRLDLDSLARGFGAEHVRVTTTEQLTEVLRAPVRGRSVIEIPVG